MKKIIIFGLSLTIVVLSATFYLNSYTSVVHAATQRFYADPDYDTYGTANDYIVRDDTERPPDGYIDWVTGHDNDNCPYVYNPDQSDKNNNGIGDACDTNTESTIDLLDINLNKIAPLTADIPDEFYISSIEYPVADFDAANSQLRPAHTLMHEILHSYYRNEPTQSYVVQLRLYDSILDAKAMFDNTNTMHTRTILDLSSSQIFGDDVFCHQSEGFTQLNSGRYYFICGMRYKNLYVQIQATLNEANYVPTHDMLRTIYNNVTHYNPNRAHPVIGSNTPPIDASVKLPDLVIEKMRVGATTHDLNAIIKNDSQIRLTQPFGIKIVNHNDGETWQKEKTYSPTNPLLPGQRVAITITNLPNGTYNLEGTVDYLNLVEESNELNNTRSDQFNLDFQNTENVSNDMDEITRLQQRIKELRYSISQLEEKFIDLEAAFVQRVDKILTNRLKGRILLQVEEKGEAWYVDGVTGQKFYLKDGNTAYQALKAFGLGISTADLEKIPVGIEDRFDDIDTDNDGLADKTEEALGTDVKNPDTDGDGFSDGDEVRGNYNPLGSGALINDTRFADGLKGKILLQVEGNGEAWYINPDDGKRYYMKDGPAAYQIMRFLSLGITNDDLRQIEVGSFE